MDCNPSFTTQIYSPVSARFSELLCVRPTGTLCADHGISHVPRIFLSIWMSFFPCEWMEIFSFLLFPFLSSPFFFSPASLLFPRLHSLTFHFNQRWYNLLPIDRNNFTEQLSFDECPPKCDGDPLCVGFTSTAQSEGSCWIYRSVRCGCTLHVRMDSLRDTTTTPLQHAPSFPYLCLSSPHPTLLSTPLLSILYTRYTIV